MTLSKGTKMKATRLLLALLLCTCSSFNSSIRPSPFEVEFQNTVNTLSRRRPNVVVRCPASYTRDPVRKASRLRRNEVLHFLGVNHHVGHLASVEI